NRQLPEAGRHIDPERRPRTVETVCRDGGVRAAIEIGSVTKKVVERIPADRNTPDGGGVHEESRVCTGAIRTELVSRDADELEGTVGFDVRLYAMVSEILDRIAGHNENARGRGGFVGILLRVQVDADAIALKLVVRDSKTAARVPQDTGRYRVLVVPGIREQATGNVAVPA